MRTEPSAKRVRALLSGRMVADTVRPVLVWEKPYYPTYFLPASDVDLEQIPAEALRHGEAVDPALAGLVHLEWGAMDAWFEEDEPVYTHPRSPYTRIDILASSRQVRFEVDGVVLAESTRPSVLFETGLPPRFYLPRPDVRLDLLVPGDKVTHCPYKGQAEYWSVRAGGALHRDLAWSYPSPLPESQKIAGLVTFYQERADLSLDGERQARPDTPFS
jgi:uncharacterized protein (DUF427 family)